MCFGTFDILHLGHLNYFKQAKKFGDYLIVVVARDKNVKGKQLTFTQKERLELLNSVELVDKAVLGQGKDRFSIIIKYKPDIICLGYDHSIKRKELKQILEEKRLKTKIVRAKAYKDKKHKSSRLRKAILSRV